MLNRLDSASRLTEPANPPATPPQATTPPVDNTRPPSPPRMRSVPAESDGMDIDSGDEQAPASPRGVKRPRQQNNDNARDDTTLPSTPPELKRQRTAAPPPPPPPPPVIETFSQQQHSDLIALIRRHGGDVVASDGDTIRIALPPATQLDFQVHYFCQKAALLREGSPFPDAEAFKQAMPETFAHHLHAATLANQASLVRMLLATGLANQSGALLRDLAKQAGAAGAMAAVDAITDFWAYWVQGLDPATLGHPTESSIQVGQSDQPPPDWQSRSRKEFNNEQAQALLNAFYNADTDAVLDLLFPPEHRPASGCFFLRVVSDSAGNLSELALSSGAITVDNHADENTLIVYSTDFNREALMHALQQQAASNEPYDGSSTSTLEMAAAWGDIALFKAVWSVIAADIREFSDLALYRAAEAGATDIVFHLLPHMDDPETVDFALSLAAKYGRTATCAALLDAGVKLPQSIALNYAAGAGHIEICALLISQGQSIDGPALEDSPLLNATRRNREKTVQLLVTAGASLGRLDYCGASVLSLAAEHGNIGLYRYLVDCGAGLQVPPRHSPPMVHAAKNNHVVMLDYLLKSGEDIERRDNEGDRPLDVACRRGAADAVAFLLEHGACLTSTTLGFTNPLSRAISADSLPVLELLLRQDLPRDDRLKALLLAIRENLPDMVSAMLQGTAANLSLIGLPPKMNPLLAVLYSGHQPDETTPHHTILSRLLREPQLPRDHVTAEGNDALMLAVKSRDATAVDMLVNAGLRIGQQSASGATALNYALYNLPVSVDVESEDSTDDLDLEHQREVILSNRILHTLSHTLLTQPDRFSLAQNAWRAQTDPTARDLALFLMFANSAPTVDLSAMMAQDSVHTAAARDALMALRADAPPYALTQILMQLGVPSPLHDRLRPLLSTFPSIRDNLFSQGVPAARALQAALDGLYLSLEAEKATLDAAPAAYYAPTLLDNDWKTTLTDMARQWLTHRIDLAAERQSNDIAPIFGDLFNRCAETLVTDDDYRSALQQQPEPGIVAARLHAAGVYASLANEIDVAWRQAWQQVSLTSEFLLDLISNDELADALLAAFREALKKGINEPSSAGNVITRIDAPAAAAQLYTDLMFQQLHMLQQFIHPEKT